MSTNSSTSWFCTSRKYSAMVSAERATRRRTPGGSSIWPKTRAAFSNTPDLGHLDDEVGALTGALAHTGEHRHTTVVLGHTTDHLGDEHGLAHAGATEQADLATSEVRGEQVDDLDAGLEHLRFDGSRAAKSGAGRWISQRSMSSKSLSGHVEHLAPHVPHVAEGAVADRHLDAATGVAHRRATA